jgi:urease accessory protein
MRRIAWLSAVFLLPHVAAAHTLTPGIGDFYAGAFNLIAGPVDVLVWLSIAGIAALHDQRSAGWVAETFATGLLTGLSIARIRQLNAPPELLDAAILLSAGALMAVGHRLPGMALPGLALLIGIGRGWHYGADTLARPGLAALAGGLTLAGYVLVACSVAVLLWFNHSDIGIPQRGWRIVALRAFGSWISAVGILWGGFTMRH